MKRREFLKHVPLAGLPLAPAAIGQQASIGFPNRPVRMIVPFAAGGITDLVARLIAEHLQRKWDDQSVIVDNRPGGGSIIGTDAVAKSEPDGYTILLSGTPMATFKVLFKRVPFDVARDFTPITQISRIRYILYINGNVPAKSLREFIAHAKANPGKLNYGSIGPGGIMLAHALFMKVAGVDLVQVPYKGVMPVSALLTNEVQMYMNGTLFPQSEVDNGRLRILAVSGDSRMRQLPNVPTFAEAGLPEFDASNWQAFFARAGTPPAIVSRLQQDISSVLQTPEVRDRIQATGSDVITGSPEELGRLLEAEMKQWEEVARFAKVEPA